MNRSSNKTRIRNSILDQGVALLMERGYHGTGINDIVSAVAIPKGSFYNYFDSKEDFGAQVIAHYIEPYIQQVESHLSQPGSDAFTALTRYYDALVEEQESRHFQGGCLLGNLLGEIGDCNETCRKALAVAVGRYRDKLKQGFERAQREGSVRTDLDAGGMADLLLQSWQGALLAMKIEQSSRPLESCCEHLLGDFFKP